MTISFTVSRTPRVSLDHIEAVVLKAFNDFVATELDTDVMIDDDDYGATLRLILMGEETLTVPVALLGRPVGEPLWNEDDIDRFIVSAFEILRSRGENVWFVSAIPELEVLLQDISNALDMNAALGAALALANIEIEDLRAKLAVTSAAMRTGNQEIVIQEARGLRSWLKPLTIGVAAGIAASIAQPINISVKEPPAPAPAPSPAAKPYLDRCEAWLITYGGNDTFDAARWG